MLLASERKNDKMPILAKSVIAPPNDVEKFLFLLYKRLTGIPGVSIYLRKPLTIFENVMESLLVLFRLLYLL